MTVSELRKILEAASPESVVMISYLDGGTGYYEEDAVSIEIRPADPKAVVICGV